MEEIKCLYCRFVIDFDDYYDEWQHIHSGDPQCRSDNGTFLMSVATPPPKAK